MAISRITRQTIIEVYKGRYQHCNCDDADQRRHAGRKFHHPFAIDLRC